jgi:uncharacterized surface protein with fasciclin (FAS1) repeats
MRRFLASSLALTSLIALGACAKSDTAEKTEAAATDTSNGTLAGTIAGAAGLSTVSASLKSSGLSNVFDGAAPYTVLAPTDDAFGALGEAGATLKTPENSAAMAAVLRAHILPGVVTVADIETALKNGKGGPVTMKTMAGDTLTFARAGEDITVTASDGASAKIDGKALTASNGVVIPIDAVLKKLPKAATPT